MSAEVNTASVDNGAEIFDVVDENNNVIRTASRDECHRDGLLHRTVHVFLFRRAEEDKVEVLLQRRADGKQVCPGQWDVSLAEHLSAGETYEDAAVRGLREELGIDIDEGRFLRIRTQHFSKQDYDDVSVRDYLFTSTFAVVYDAEIDDEIIPDKAEVAEVQWCDCDTVRSKAVESPSMFTIWFSLELKSFDISEMGRTIVEVT